MAKRSPKSTAAPSAPAPTRVTQSPIRLTKALSPQEFGKLVKHVPEWDFSKLALSSLHHLLIEKGIVSQMEVQQAFLDEVERKGF